MGFFGNFSKTLNATHSMQIKHSLVVVGLSVFGMQVMNDYFQLLGTISSEKFFKNV